MWLWRHRILAYVVYLSLKVNGKENECEEAERKNVSPPEKKKVKTHVPLPSRVEFWILRGASKVPEMYSPLNVPRVVKQSQSHMEVEVMYYNMWRRKDTSKQFVLLLWILPLQKNSSSTTQHRLDSISRYAKRCDSSEYWQRSGQIKYS